MFKQRISAMIASIKAIPLAEGFAKIRIPGEKRQLTAAERTREGIPISENLLEELNQAALELGIQPLR